MSPYIESEPPSRSPSPGMAKSTLYPKISGKLPDLKYAIDKVAERNPDLLTKPIPFVGTVKLHGTHADVLVHPDGEIVCQSRNRTVITPESDNLGFATFCASRELQITALAEHIRVRWRERHPEAVLEGPVLMAGEWIGEGIQKGVAIAKLSKRFVVCSICIADIWERISAYAELEDASAGIFNISQGGFFHLSYSYADEGKAFLAEAKKLTLEVAEACPFGKAFGAEGEGEGIVWVPAVDSGLPNESAFWLKTKAEHFHHKIHLAVSAEKATAQADQRERAKAFAAETCTESRMEQGWQYLAEMGVEQSMKGMGRYLIWLTGDIEVEEKRELEALKLGNSWKGEISKIAKPWFEKRMREQE